jgi:hypothetical protein
MPDYSKTKIYIIRSCNTNKVYIGSTVQSLSKRYGDHVSRYNKWLKEGKKFCSSKFILEQGGSYIELLENYPCNSVIEKNKKEGSVIREYLSNGLAVNKNIAGRCKKQWAVDNLTYLNFQKKCVDEEKQKLIKSNKKKYYETNKQDIKNKKKKYYEENKDYFIANSKKWVSKNEDKSKQYKKKYYEENKEDIKNKSKKNYEKNKEKLLQTYTCKCGSVLSNVSKKRHQSTIKHQSYINNL